MFDRTLKFNSLDKSDSEYKKQIEYQSANLERDGIGLTVSFNEEHPKLAWKYKNLFQAMHIMFLYNLTIGKYPIKLCASDDCNNWFSATTKTKKYCSDSCGSLMRVRNLRKRRKMNKEV